LKVEQIVRVPRPLVEFRRVVYLRSKLSKKPLAIYRS